MSFLSALGNAFKVAGGVTQVVAPFSPIISSIPGIGGPFGLIFSTIVQVEALAGEGPGKGADKKAAAIALLALAHPGVDKVALGNLIDGIVAVLNNAQKIMPPTVDVGK